VNRAVRFSRFGGPEVLEIVDRPIDEPGAVDVRVALRAAGLNPADAKRREGGPQ
jgi:NADPH:quinone reductase-like Zn-dependent oxidoreductase